MGTDVIIYLILSIESILNITEFCQVISVCFFFLTKGEYVFYASVRRTVRSFVSLRVVYDEV